MQYVCVKFAFQMHPLGLLQLRMDEIVFSTLQCSYTLQKSLGRSVGATANVPSYSIYIRTVSSSRLLSTLLIQYKLVYGLFGQSNMNSTLDYCPRPARKETNVPLNKRSYKLTVLIYTVLDMGQQIFDQMVSIMSDRFSWYTHPQWIQSLFKALS